MKFYCNLNTAKILLKCWSLGEESIRYSNLLEISHEKEIIQILEMGLTYVGGKKHKTETLICAFECFAWSRSSYSRMWEDYELPSITTLTSWHLN